MKIKKPLNEVQIRFNELCDKGGGQGGGPARTKVQELLHEGSQTLNAMAFDEISSHLKAFPEANPWHVCFAVGLGWGHLAKIDEDFTAAAIRVLSDLDEEALKDAKLFHLERGPMPIEQSLRGGYLMFQKVKLPAKLPHDLRTMGRAQERWLSPILSNSNDRPKYIGSWNATAMFMVALFADPDLGATLKSAEVMLPPGGPIYAGLSILHNNKVLNSAPHGSALDEEAFEPGSIYLNSALMAELLVGREGWSMIDVHSGLYMLGTRYPLSKEWA
ncbi:MAG: hypothetical protein ACSHXB_18905 [Sulfitobacter sp.]